MKKRIIGILLVGSSLLIGCANNKQEMNVNQLDIQQDSINQEAHSESSENKENSEEVSSIPEAVKVDDQLVNDCFAKAVIDLKRDYKIDQASYTCDFDGDGQLELLVFSLNKRDTEMHIQMYEYGEEKAIMTAEMKKSMGSNSDGGSTFTVVKDQKGNYYLKDDCWGDGWEYTDYTAYNNSFEEKAYFRTSVAANRHVEGAGRKSDDDYRINGKEAKKEDFLAFCDNGFSEEAKLISYEPLKLTFEDYTNGGKAIVQKASEELLKNEDLDSELKRLDTPFYLNDQDEVVIKDWQIKALLFDGLGTSLLKGEFGSLKKDGYGGYKVPHTNFSIYAETVNNIESISMEKGCEVLGLHFTETPDQVHGILGEPKNEAVMESSGLYTQYYVRDTYELWIEYDEAMSMQRILAKATYPNQE